MKRAVLMMLGGGLDMSVSTWVSRGSALGYTVPSASVQNALSAFVISLKMNGLFTRMKTGYILHAGSVQMGSLNLKDPTTYQTSLVNSPSFSEGNGTRSNGTSSYINQPFLSNEYSGIQTDLTTIQYISESNTTPSSTQYACGVRTNSAPNYYALGPLNQGTSAAVFNYLPAAFLPTSGAQHKGLYIFRGKNDAAETVILWKDGTKFSMNSTSPTAPNLSSNRFILALNDSASSGGTNPTSYYPKYVAVDFLFDGFSDTDAANFKTAFDTYKTAVGLP